MPKSKITRLKLYLYKLVLVLFIQTAKLNLEALNSFMNLYSRFKNFKLYLAGESYAGIYINTLASLIIKHKGQLKKQLKVLKFEILKKNNKT